MQLLDMLNGDLSEFTPIPFWFLNDDLNNKELTRQLEDFCEKGVNGVVVHPRIGIPKTIPYLSPVYFDFITHIVKTAASLNMKIVLYDEAMYPSGTAHGEVVRQNPEFASVGLFHTDTPRGKIIAELHDGSFLEEKPCGGTIRGIHFGEDDGEPGAPPSADILNSNAVKAFISLTHDVYYRHLKQYFGCCIIGFFTDEPAVLGRGAKNCFPWTSGLETDICNAGGNLKELAGLFSCEANTTTAIYEKVVKNRLCTVYYKQLSDWCESHGIALMGHPEKSDDIDELSYFHIPGQDLIMRRVAPENGGISGMDSVQAKCSADAARHSGKRRNSNECFGVCGKSPWHFPFGDRKWILDWLGVRGVNMFIPHAFYYSLKGERKNERPPDVGLNDIGWKHYKIWSNYMKRLSFLMTDSKNCARVGIPCESGHMPYKEVAPLYENQIEFNYVPTHSENLGGYTYTHTLETAFEAPRDFTAHTPRKNLRVSHIVKFNEHVYLCTNEGSESINITASVSEKGTVLHYDLWNDKLFRIGSSDSFNLKLAPFESAALLIDRNDEIKVSPPPITQEIYPRFTLVSQGKNTKIYSAEVALKNGAENVVLCAKAAEMVEWQINGVFGGVSFWNTHRCFSPNLLHEGVNEVIITVTGSTSNLFGEVVPFGII